MSEKGLYSLIKRNFLSNVKKEEKDRYTHYLPGKQTEVSFKSNLLSRRCTFFLSHLLMIFLGRCGSMP